MSTSIWTWTWETSTFSVEEAFLAWLAEDEGSKTGVFERRCIVLDEVDNVAQKLLLGDVSWAATNQDTGTLFSDLLVSCISQLLAEVAESAESALQRSYRGEAGSVLVGQTTLLLSLWRFAIRPNPRLDPDSCSCGCYLSPLEFAVHLSPASPQLRLAQENAVRNPRIFGHPKCGSSPLPAAGCCTDSQPAQRHKPYVNQAHAPRTAPTKPVYHPEACLHSTPRLGDELARRPLLRYSTRAPLPASIMVYPPPLLPTHAPTRPSLDHTIHVPRPVLHDAVPATLSLPNREAPPQRHVHHFGDAGFRCCA
uniref:Uncharacterized protein n=1 Tax=Mycena chlorophos TaxID=658473 RepID=A0ABQ0LK59_MYCCL|nr:predicted protein [Mycena chlorophos]